VITNFDHKGKKIYKDRKPFYDANNARNRCLFTSAKAMGTLYNAASTEALSSAIDTEENLGTPDSVENAMLARIDLKRAGLLGDED